MSESPTCKYCKKQFRKESLLAVHLCEPKRRWQQEKETGVNLGLQAYLRFYEYTQGSSKNRTYADFVESPYYSAFVRFGQYLVQIRAINVPRFIDWIIKNNKKLDQWTKDDFYTQYLFDYLRHENPTDAVERSLNEMQLVSEDLGFSLIEFFAKCGQNKISQMVVYGRISPWVIYNCKSGTEFLSRLNEEQIKMVYPFIDPEHWDRKLKDYFADSEMIKEGLAASGL